MKIKELMIKYDIISIKKGVVEKVEDFEEVVKEGILRVVDKDEVYVIYNR